MAYPQYRGQKNKVHNTGITVYGGDGTDMHPISVDANGYLQMELVTYGTLGDGRTVCGTAGTRVQASTVSVATKAVILTAELDNTGVMVVGGSTIVASAVTSRIGTPLQTGASVTLYIDNLNKVYLDATVSGEGVHYTYMV